MKISKIKNCYGYDNTELKNLDLSTNNNLIFGSNGTGKTSISQVLLDFKKNRKIENKFSSDGEPKVELELNGFKIFYDNNRWINRMGFDTKSLFIFNKKYLGDSYFIQKDVIFIGDGIRGYKEKIDEKEKSENAINTRLINLKNSLAITSKKNLPKQMKKVNKLYTTKSRLITLLKDQKSKNVNKPSKEFKDVFDANKNLLSMKYPEIDKLMNLLRSNSSEVLSKRKFKYIKKHMDIDRFTEFVFSFEKDLVVCPICLRGFTENNKWQKIKQEIQKEKKEFIDNSITDFISKELNIYGSDKSIYINEYISLLKSVCCFEYDNNLIKSLNELKRKIDQFVMKSDDYLYELFINENHKDISVHINNSKFCNDFEDKAILKAGLDIQDKIDEIINEYSLDNLKKFNITFNESTFSLEVSVSNSRAQRPELEGLFCESEITTLSLILFVIDVTRNSNESKIVFLDDPVDSTDENIKHKLTYIISNEFLEKENLTTVVLTHKLSFVRLIKFYCKKYFLFVLSEEFINSQVRIFTKDRGILDNNFSLYNKLLYQLKLKRLSEEHKKINLLVMSTILRDVIEIKKDYSSSKVQVIRYINQYKKLSNNIIHYNPITASKKDFDYLIKFYNKNSGYKFKNIFNIIKKKIIIKFNRRVSVDAFIEEFYNNYTVMRYSDFNEYFRVKIFTFLIIRRLIEKRTYEYVVKNCLKSSSYLKRFQVLWNDIYKTTDLVNLNSKSGEIRKCVNYENYVNSSFYKRLSIIVKENKTLINSIYHPINSSINTYFYNSINDYMEILNRVNNIS